jgi:hypothetical protein
VPVPCQFRRLSIGCSWFLMHLLLPVLICVVWWHQWGVIFIAYLVVDYAAATFSLLWDRSLMTLPVMISSFVHSDDCLSCLLMIVACDVNTHDCAIWACVYCLWTDRYILVLCSLVIIVCDRCFLTSIFIPLILSTCPIPNNYIAKPFFFCSFEFSVQLNYVHCCFVTSGGMPACLKKKHNKGRCFLALEVHLI